MKTYLLSILAVSLTAAFLFHLLPERPSLKRGLRFLLTLLLLSLLLSPLLGAKGALAGFFAGDWILDTEELQSTYEEKSRSSLLSHSKAYLENLLKEKIVKEFSLSDEDISVRLLWEEDEPKKIFLVLSGKAIWQDSARMEAFAEELLGLPASSVIE